MAVGGPLGLAACGTVAAETVVEGWASSGGGCGPAMAESGARPRLAEDRFLRLDGRSEPDPVREHDGGSWAGEFWALRALLCLWVVFGVDCRETYRSYSSALFIFREACMSELPSASLNPATVHFPIGGIVGTAER